MQEAIRYSKAPIVEAILAVQIACAAPTTYEFSESMLGDYKQLNPIYESEFSLNVEDASAKGSTRTIGRSYISSHGKQVAHFKVDGFAFSRLAPYDKWETFAEEAKRLFDLYVSGIETKWEVKSIVLRYINKLILPIGPSIDEFLNVYTFLPEDFPSNMQGYFIRLEILLTEPIPGVLTMQHAILQDTTQEGYSFVIDNEFKFPTEAKNDQLWSLFEQIRHLKNQTFNRILTNKAKELIR